jgi:hypothetical protein
LRERSKDWSKKILKMIEFCQKRKRNWRVRILRRSRLSKTLSVMKKKCGRPLKSSGVAKKTLKAS